MSKTAARWLVMLAALVVVLGLVEGALRQRERRLMAGDLQQIENSNVQQLSGRREDDVLRLRFFNGAAVSRNIMHADPELGFVNVPDKECVMVRIIGQANAVVEKPFDVAQLAKGGAPAEAT